MTAKNLGASRLVSASPIFYGWIVWFVAMIGVICSAPGQSFSASLFLDHFIADFGLDRTSVSSLYGAGTFIASLGLTWVGRQLDRMGNRRTGAAVALLLAIVLVLCSLISGPFTLLLAFIGLRGLGQGSLTLISSTAVANWFRQRRGSMMALMALAFALFQGVYVNALRLLLETLDWRQAYIILGLGVGAIAFPAFALLMRDQPEDYGLSPDNAEGASMPSVAGAATDEHNWTLAAAMRTSIFWVFAFTRVLPSAWGTGLILHQVSIFAALGHSARVATETYALMSIFAAISALPAGYLIDRIRPSFVAAIAMLALFATSLLAMTMRDTPSLALYAATFGLGLGIGYVFDGAVWPNLFGRKFQGEIRGFVFTAIVAGSALGPALFGLSYDYAGGYALVLSAGAALCLLALALTVVVPQPRRRLHAD